MTQIYKKKEKDEGEDYRGGGRGTGERGGRERRKKAAQRAPGSAWSGSHFCLLEPYVSL